MQPRAWLLAFILTFAASVLRADAVKDREGAVRGDRARMENDARWIYNDVDRGFAEAKRTGRPLLVVLRCVPCLSCVGLDAQVLTEPGLAPLLDQFVCVRLINANAIDLARFQFDYDLSFSTLFFNADGTLYGRYGSWTHQADPEARETIGYRRALEAALETHRGYPANRAGLERKQGGPTPFRMPVEIPALAGRYGRELNWGGEVVKSCVHCHQVGEAFRAYYRDRGEKVPLERIYPMPAPETVGVSLAPDHVARIASVVSGSPAARAGFRPGDDVLALDGQRLISVADFAWALHQAPEAAKLPAVVRRAGAEMVLTLELPAGWRIRTDISKRVGTWSMRAMALGGLVLTELGAEETARRGLPAGGMALLVKGMGQFNKHGAAKKAGFLKDDVVVRVGEFGARMGEGELIGRILQSTRPGGSLDVEVLRGAERMRLSLPMQ
jgi:serine protease Do